MGNYSFVEFIINRLSPKQVDNIVSHEGLLLNVQIPPYGKGSLYIRPLLIGTGPILGLAPAPEYTFLVYACPVGNYFKVFKINKLILVALILSCSEIC